MTTISRTKTKSISIIVVPEYLLTQDDDLLASRVVQEPLGAVIDDAVDNEPAV